MFDGLFWNRACMSHSTKLYLSRQRRTLVQQIFLHKNSLNILTCQVKLTSTSERNQLFRLWTILYRLKLVIRLGRKRLSWYFNLFCYLLCICSSAQAQYFQALNAKSCLSVSNYGKLTTLDVLQKPKSSTLRFWAWTLASASLTYANILPTRLSWHWRLGTPLAW